MITLVLGGTRSGKSQVAERLAQDAAEGARGVSYIATARVDPADAEQVARVARHRRRRPAEWSTLEAAAPADLPEALVATGDVVLVDSLGTWVAAHPDLDLDAGPLLAALGHRRDRGAATILVSEEVGLSVHPTTELGRRFVDVLGDLNQQVSAIADRVLLVVAGRVVELPGEVSPS